ncbi:MAG: hypothetical protein DRI34_06765 [Deltaproteobacteria bacterium]|nr:MAG: hypothetical protein DRI34_06765 [Deltaproteobacteria bacterium]
MPWCSGEDCSWQCCWRWCCCRPARRTNSSKRPPQRPTRRRQPGQRPAGRSPRPRPARTSWPATGMRKCAAGCWRWWPGSRPPPASRCPWRYSTSTTPASAETWGGPSTTT